ncbi:diacylglycerol kinase family protein [Cellulomonas sp. ATA003]|uniref:diacylglycerol/lipid kinase family protein n=1 Tax=Cellulomonas sp. ATA003 TaxID=3073064 RepID=UPI0028730112|nr:diacylglycerol kinase family protein [Cellulomonas sp. ATA003]WNB87137.1 diacylglycerol kinase family protein [Cellulomonas sp. ATA003]
MDAAPTDRATAQPGPHLAPADERRPLRSAVVVNPVRVEDLPTRKEAVEAALAEAGWPAPQWIETTAEDPGAGQARQAIADGAELVFVCGGDGTVRSTIEGVAGTDVALAVLPAGTGNLLATNLGVPDDPRAGVHLATQWGRRRLDVGDVDGQAFAVMAGMGFDAALLEDASTDLKAKIGPLAYVLSAVRHLTDRRATVRVSIDGRAPVRRRARSVVIGNVGRLQGGVTLLADAEPDNGQMDVAILAPRTVGHWVALAWGVVRRRRDVAHMQVLRGTDITVSWDSEQPRELDGDVIEPGRSMRVTVRPGALLLCVPQPEESPDLSEGAERLAD